ncbi:hypothetical protein Acr_01g0002940 [Actinidia rufa]|uniref:Glycosyl hydrolase superfamily protein n=1 Tax=Actinidia rufa TaxID=165716 RepID=A0A7J0E1W0_9ERIC|nr:hypothetical protein Acr_01g0002940 [Actinidia rufa]
MLVTFAPAMQKLRNILDARHLARISVTTVVSMAVFQTSYPPSSCAFSAEARGTLVEVLKPANVQIDYALFTAPGPVVRNGGLSYQNIFDATIDAFYWAMEREGVTDVGVAVSETGWPSGGNGNFTTPELALTYNKNLAIHIAKNGTPKRPLAYVEGYIFAMFNENLKLAGVEQHFGLFFPPNRLVYAVSPSY